MSLPGALTEDNPLPAVMGRVCYHCARTRNRGDRPSPINSVERFGRRGSGKAEIAKPKAESGKRVLIVGAIVRSVGRLPPATAHDVAIFEADRWPAA
jgi:hypothetical protein